METLQWLEYFTDGVADVHISVGSKVYTSRRNPNYAPQEVFAAGDDASLIESASEEEVNIGEFFHELSKIINSKSQWEQFFSNQGINLAVPGVQGGDRFRLHAQNGTTGKPHMDIRRIPSEIKFSPDN